MSEIINLSSNNTEMDFKRTYYDNYDDLRIGKTREIILQEKDSIKLSLEAHHMWSDYKGRKYMQFPSMFMTKITKKDLNTRFQ